MISYNYRWTWPCEEKTLIEFINATFSGPNQPHGLVMKELFSELIFLYLRFVATHIRNTNLSKPGRAWEHSARNLGAEGIRTSPDDDNDAVKAIIWVFDVAKEPQSQELQQHLQTEQACEHHVTDLQNICQFLWLQRHHDSGEKSKTSDVEALDRQHRNLNK